MGCNAVKAMRARAACPYTRIRSLAARMAAGLALALCASLATAQMALDVIALHHRTAEELIPVLQPMLVREGSISGVRGQLVVRTTPENLAELRRILASIDIPRRRLLITVAQDLAADGRRRGAEVSGTLRTDDQLRLSIPGTGVAPARGGVQARLVDDRSTEHLRVLQSVQVLDGHSAYVQTGQSAPVPERRITRSVGGGRVVEQVVESADYRSVETGFYVMPRVAGERVTLDISSRREAFTARQPGALDVQRAVTSVSGRLGEWLEVAAVTEERSAENDVLLGRSSSARAESRSVLLKVEALR